MVVLLVYRYWSAGDIEFLKSHYPNTPTRDMASKLGRSISSVRQKARKLGIPKVGRPGYRFPDNLRTYEVNEGSMNTLDKKTAYVLGFVLADGWVGDDRVNITNKNAIILAKIRIALGCTHKLTLYRDEPYSIFTITITNKTLAQSFRRYGFESTKTYNATLPNVPDCLFGHFLRGYFDGDGHSRYDLRGGLQVRFVSGSRVLLEQLSERLHRLLSVPRQPVANDRGKPAANRLWYTGANAKVVGELMYADAGDLYIEAKRTAFIDYENRPHRPKLNEDKVREIRGLCQQGVPMAQIGRQFGISPSMVNLIDKRQRWAHVK